MPQQPSTILFLCSGNYYRSRFAELLFNHYAQCVPHTKSQSLPYRADSAGLLPNCWTRNPGPISPYTISALQARGVPLPRTHRAPRDVSEHDIRTAALTIAVKEAEHRPLVRERFPALLDRIEFWRVDDVQDAPPSIAIPILEENVQALLARLSSGVGAPWRPAGDAPAGERWPR